MATKTTETLNLADPKDGPASDEAQGFMADVIDADALKVNSAAADAAKSAKICEVTVTEFSERGCNLATGQALKLNNPPAGRGGGFSL